MRDKNFRIEIAEDGIHVYNRDGHHVAQDAFALYDKLGVDKDGPHAFYLGAELARAEIAWRLAKRYAQDEPLDWGVAADAPADDKTRLKEAGHTLIAKKKREALAERYGGHAHAHDPRTHRHHPQRGGQGAYRPARADRRRRAASIIAPFRPSTTLDNLRATPYAVANFTDDVLVFAGCLTGRKDWPTRPSTHVPGAVLEGALAHAELAVDHVEEDEQRPRFHCRVVHEASHAPFKGFNRAQAAVIEAAILASRLHMLPREKIERELGYLADRRGEDRGSARARGLAAAGREDRGPLQARPTRAALTPADADGRRESRVRSEGHEPHQACHRYSLCRGRVPRARERGAASALSRSGRSDLSRRADAAKRPTGFRPASRRQR